MSKVREFIHTYRQFRRAAHSRRYAFRIAYGCAFQNLPF
jgi:hypothetical protein